VPDVVDAFGFFLEMCFDLTTHPRRRGILHARVEYGVVPTTLSHHRPGALEFRYDWDEPSFSEFEVVVGETLIIVLCSDVHEEPWSSDTQDFRLKCRHVVAISFKSLHEYTIPRDSWCFLAQDRKSWRETIQQALPFPLRLVERPVTSVSRLPRQNESDI